MKAVRCPRCLKVFTVQQVGPHGNVRCPGCNSEHRVSSMASSTAGDSMMISRVKLKKMLDSPSGAADTPRQEPIVMCPKCRVKLYVNFRKYAGRRVACPECKETIQIPRVAVDPDSDDKKA